MARMAFVQVNIGWLLHELGVPGTLKVSGLAPISLTDAVRVLIEAPELDEVGPGDHIPDVDLLMTGRPPLIQPESVSVMYRTGDRAGETVTLAPTPPEIVDLTPFAGLLPSD